MALTQLIVPSHMQMLRTLSGLLDKAQAQLGAADAEALLRARIAPDMYPLATQIRFVCVQAHEAIYRLRGDALPKAVEVLAQEGRNAGEQPGSMADAQARISEALALLDGLAPDALDDGAQRPISIAVPGGLIFDMNGEQYVRDWALPQFYFHLITAYAILRHQGIDLGKADYVPHMFAYLRPGTMPEG